MKAQNKSGFCHNLIICCKIYQISYSSKRSNINIEATSAKFDVQFKYFNSNAHVI